MSQKTIRGAVIGYGGAFNMGKQHLGSMEKAGFTPIAACDVDAERVKVAASDFPGIHTYTDVPSLLKDEEVDVIALITPHNTHAELAIQAMNAGKSIVCEKPLCITAQEATDMIEAAKKNNVVLTVFHNRRHDGDFKALKEVIVEKKLIGDVFSIQAGFAGYGHPGHWWRANKEISGGAFYDWGAHFLDWILNLLPGQKVVNVIGFFHKSVWHDVTNEDHVQAIIRFDSGAHVDLSFSSISAVGMPRWRILGTMGGIIADPNKNGALMLHTQHEGIAVQGEIRNKEGAWDQYYKDLYAHMAEGAPLDVTPESSRRVIAIIEAAEKSSKSGQAEPVPYE
jgi:scyllo-inositol 2-dehydrogenase (NADP+)